MTTSSGIRVRILGDDSDLQNKLRNSATAVAKWGAAATAAAAAGGAALVRSGLQSADAQAKLARGLGATTEGLGALQRAAGRAGVSTTELESATLRLNQRLGQAITEGGKAGETLDALGLSAQDLSNMDVDERMAAISDAMRGAGLSSQEMAFHLRNLGIRQSAIVNLMQEGGDAIRESRSRIEAYGLALTDIDAAKVEAANDAMEEGSVVMRGLTQQLAVQFAPVLQGIADLMADAAAETGGLGGVAERAFDMVIKGAGFAANAVRGIQVVVKAIEAAFWGLSAVTTSVFKSIMQGWDNAANGIGEGINRLIRGMNNLPGVNIDELEIGSSKATEFFTKMSDAAHDNMSRAANELHELLMQPLPSEGLEDWVSKVKQAADDAARATVEARQGLSIPGIGEDEDTSEEDAKAAEDLAKLQDRLNDRMEVIRRSLMDERELEVAEHWDRINDINEARDAGVLSLEEHQRLEQQLSEQHQDRLTAIDRAGIAARMNMASQMFGNIATLMQTENKKLFEIGKVAAISQAVVDGISAVQSSYAQGTKLAGPIGGAAFAATAALATGVQISKLASTSYGSKSTGGGAPSGGNPTVPQQAAQESPQRSLMVQGDFDSSSLFTGDAVRGLIDKIAEAQADGYTVTV